MGVATVPKWQLAVNYLSWITLVETAKCYGSNRPYIIIIKIMILMMIVIRDCIRRKTHFFFLKQRDSLDLFCG